MTRSISQLPAEEILKIATDEKDRLVQIFRINRRIGPEVRAVDLARVEGAIMVIHAIRAAMQDRS